MEPTVRDVLAFHRVDRAAYEHLVSLGAGRQAARDTVALLMWLHHSVGADAVASVCVEVRTPADAARLVSDALAVLHGVAWPRPHRRQGARMPLVCGGCGGAVAADARPFLAGLVPGGGAEPRARCGVAGVLRGVGALVFDDRLQALRRRHEKEGGPVPAELAAPYRPGDADDEEGEGGRSLFITFSKGFPLTREEISAYFTERWGEGCVDSVMIERTPPLGEPPRYGRVAFRWASVAEAVLGGQRLVKLLVNGRQLWARKYVPKPHQPPLS